MADVPEFADWTTQLEAASLDALKEWARGGVGEPEREDTCSQ